MIGDKYIVINDCLTNRFHVIKKGDILIEKGALNTETECIEDAGVYNELVHEVYGYVCDAGSDFTIKNLTKIH